MAVKLRLTRVGSKKNPIYRVVAADSHSPRDGKFLEIVGRYNPQTNPSLIELDDDKVKRWLGKGARWAVLLTPLKVFQHVSLPLISAPKVVAERIGDSYSLFA